MKWMRRSRYVAREFANERRLDTFAPATGAHTSNLLPLRYLWSKLNAMESPDPTYKPVLGWMSEMHFSRCHSQIPLR